MRVDELTDEKIWLHKTDHLVRRQRMYTVRFAESSVGMKIGRLEVPSICIETPAVLCRETLE